MMKIYVIIIYIISNYKLSEVTKIICSEARFLILEYHIILQIFLGMKFYLTLSCQVYPCSRHGLWLCSCKTPAIYFSWSGQDTSQSLDWLLVIDIMTLGFNCQNKLLGLGFYCQSFRVWSILPSNSTGSLSFNASVCRNPRIC